MQKNSLSTIKNIANVCCVQFSPYSAHLLSFGSANYRTYCYDLRNVSAPLCVLAGHERAVSYVKFLDSETIVSMSTDNTLKLWDLNKTSFGCLSTNACVLTYRGHTNEKVRFFYIYIFRHFISLNFSTPGILFSWKIHVYRILSVYLLLMDTLLVVQKQTRFASLTCSFL